MIGLAFLFFLTALLYACVGFGGGSTYNALLALNGVDYRLLPSIALICNLIVVSGGVWRFALAGHLNVGRLVPFICASLPMAVLGGRLPISEMMFTALLGISLIAAAAQMLVTDNSSSHISETNRAPLIISLGIGGVLGLLAGTVGIGGGIFLAPALYFLRWGTPQQIAAACSFFILINSLGGLLGQVLKLGTMNDLPGLFHFWPLFLSVLIGGQIGTRLGALNLPDRLIKRLTAGLMIYVGIRLLLRWWGIAVV